MCQKVIPLIARQELATRRQGESAHLPKDTQGLLTSTEKHISETRACFPWWIKLGWPVTPNGSAIINTRYCGSDCGTVFRAAALNKAFQLSVEPEGGHGFPSAPDTAAGCVGFTHGGLVCGPPSEHILQLLPPLPLDISAGLPLPAVHGKALSSVFFTTKQWLLGDQNCKMPLSIFPRDFHNYVSSVYCWSLKVSCEWIWVPSQKKPQPHAFVCTGLNLNLMHLKLSMTVTSQTFVFHFWCLIFRSSLEGPSSQLGSSGCVLCRGGCLLHGY